MISLQAFSCSDIYLLCIYFSNYNRKYNYGMDKLPRYVNALSPGIEKKLKSFHEMIATL